MKSITLTKKQKSQLIEMCNKLFPEVKWHFWTNEDDFDLLNECFIGYNRQITIGKKKQPYKDGLVIHWFEFCLLHMAEKILNRGSLSDHATTQYCKWIMAALIEQVHPVDYLYKEFKKLK